MVNGFKVHLRGDQIEFHSFGTPAMPQNRYVSFFQLQSHCSILLGRLYYRGERVHDLKNDLRRKFLQTCEINDAALALAIYFSFGLRGLARLEGDFSLAVWDGTERQLIGMRDPMGGYPLFWTKQKGRTALGTSLPELTSCLQSPRIDREYLAEYLLALAPMNELASERSVYTNVHRVLPGTMIMFDAFTGRTQRHTYWDWLQRRERPESDRLDEVGVQYAHLLRSATRERINGKTATHVSGGMDSTAITLLCRELIESGFGQKPLQTISLIYHELPGLARETPYVETVLRAQENGIEAHCIPADGLLDFDAYTDPPSHDEPFAGLMRVAMDRATIDLAAKRGIHTVLTGLGADELLDVQPFYLSDLLRSGHLLSAWKEATRWAAADNCSPWELLHTFGIANAFPRWLRGGGLLPFDGSKGANLINQKDGAIPIWIRPEFARQYHLRERTLDKVHKTYRSTPSTTLSLALSSIESRTGDVNRWYLADPQGVFVAHPFLDARVLRFGLGMLDRIKAQPGMMKPVLVAAIGHRLPKILLERKRKGHFNEVYYLGLSRNLNYLEKLVQRTEVDELGIFDRDNLIPCLQQASLGAAGVRSSQRLNLALSFIRWFTLQNEQRDRPEPGTNLIQTHRHEVVR